MEQLSRAFWRTFWKGPRSGALSSALLREGPLSGALLVAFFPHVFRRRVNGRTFGRFFSAFCFGSFFAFLFFGKKNTEIKRQKQRKKATQKCGPGKNGKKATKSAASDPAPERNSDQKCDI